jgi:hypothetical protein
MRQAGERGLSATKEGDNTVESTKKTVQILKKAVSFGRGLGVSIMIPPSGVLDLANL